MDEEKLDEKNARRRERYKLCPDYKKNVVALYSFSSDDDEASKSKKQKLPKKKKGGISSTNHQSMSAAATQILQNRVTAEEERIEAAALVHLNRANKSSAPSLAPLTSHLQVDRGILQSFSGLNYSHYMSDVDFEEEAQRQLIELERTHEERITEAYENETEWKKRRRAGRINWNASRKEFSNSAKEGSCPSFEFCHQCHSQTNAFVIRCDTCKKDLCSDCDDSFHSFDPFHKRTFFSKKDFIARQLLPVEFVKGPNLKDIISKGIPVPCHLPSCPNCCKPTIRLQPGRKQKFVVTLEGRFDLFSSEFHCIECSYLMELTEKDYIKSNWWPGSTSGSRYLFSGPLLEFWYNLNHQLHGPSTNKFVATLNRIASNAGRSEVIDIPLFDKASREFQFHHYGLDTSIREQESTKCPSCGDPYDDDDPLFTPDGVEIKKRHACVDGLMKLVRLASASQGDGERLFGEALFASNETVDSHLKNENVDKGFQSAQCGGTGGNAFTAAKENSKSKKNYKETGAVIACCRHLMILYCVNIYVGEAYRFAHFLHNKLFQLGYKVFCYDIVCMYWPWAQKVGARFPQFKHLTEKMLAFLPRWHAIAHVWHCFMRWVGHYLEGVGATVGEEQEQVNASLALYRNKTIHMTEENRIDELTQAGIYLNKERIRKMPEFLANRLRKTRIYVQAYTSKLNKKLITSKHTKADLPGIFEELVNLAKECAKTGGGKEPATHLFSEIEATFFEFQSAQKKVDDAVYCIPRTRAVRLRNAAKKRAAKLIKKLNNWKAKADIDSEEDSEDDGEIDDNEYITMDDFLKGLFPWQLSDENDTFKEKRDLVELWKLSERYKEEIILFESEMKTFLKSIDRTIQKLKNKIPESSDIPQLDVSDAFIVYQEITRLRAIRRRAVYIFQLTEYCDDSDDGDSDYDASEEEN